MKNRKIFARIVTALAAAAAIFVGTGYISDRIIYADFTTYGDLLINGGISGTDFEYDETGKILTIKTGKQLTITCDTLKKVEDRIIIQDNVTANITFDNMKMECNEAPVQVGENSTLNLTLDWERHSFSYRKGRHSQ